MATWVYQARNRAGERVSGTREASDRQSAIEALREAGLFVTQLEPAKPNKNARNASTHNGARLGQTAMPQIMPQPLQESELHRAREGAQSTENRWAETPRNETSHRMEAGRGDVRGPGVPQPQSALPNVPTLQGNKVLRASAKDLSLYFRQMHAMVNGGTSLWHALQTLGLEAPSASLRTASREMANHLQRGGRWSEAMKAYPGLFSELMVGMISAGETGGFLDRMCLRLSEYSERDYELQQTIKRETWYPKLLVFCAILIPSAVPVVIASMTGGNAIAAWFQSSAPKMLLLIGLIWFTWKAANFAMPLAARENSPRYWLDWLKLQIPIVGKTSRALATTKFCRALGALYSAGVGPHKAVEMAGRACGNAAMQEQARIVSRKLQNGAGLTTSLAETGVFPRVALQMMSVGETSGDLDVQLDKVADFLEQDAETTIKQSVKVLGIATFLLIAIYIAMTVIQFYAGYFNSVMDIAG
jgi:type IV pilus assembly protein PilC